MVEKTTVDGSSGRGRAKLLAVDDEELMCELLSAMLADEFEVVVLSHAKEALTRLLAGEEFDLILCDLMMPDVTGMELFEQLSKERPAQAERIVFMTGGTFTEEAHEFLAQPGRQRLQKPFRHEALLELVRQRLAELGPLGSA